MRGLIFSYLCILIFIFSSIKPFYSQHNPRAWAEWEETNGIILHQPNYYNLINPTPMDIQVAEEWDSLYITLISNCIEENVNVYYILDTNDRPEYHSAILDTLVSKYEINIDHPNFHIVYGSRENYGKLTKWTRDHGPMNVYQNQVDSLTFILFRDDNRGAGGIIRDYLNIKDTVYEDVNSAQQSSDGGNYMVDGNKIAIIDGGNFAKLPDCKRKFGLDTIHLIPHYLSHCDYYMKYVNEETVIVAKRLPHCYTLGTEPYNYKQDSIKISEIISDLQYQIVSQFGRPLNIFQIPTPPSMSDDSLKLWYHTQHASYTNSLIVNNMVFVPQFDVSWFDSLALETYQKAMPGYKIIPVYSRRGVVEGGAVHCLTNSVAAFDPIKITHEWFIDTVQPQQYYNIEALITTKDDVKQAKVYYAYVSEGPYETVKMNKVSNDLYKCSIPAGNNNCSIFYYINAISNSGKSISKPFVAPDWTFKIDIKEGSNGLNSNHSISLGTLHIYPNPSQGISKIAIPNDSFNHGELLSLFVYNLFGKILIKRNITNTGNPIEFKSQMLPHGEYFILVCNRKGLFLSNKLVIK